MKNKDKVQDAFTARAVVCQKAPVRMKQHLPVQKFALAIVELYLSEGDR